MNTLKLRKQMENNLDPGRYEHTLSVAFTAMSLAMRYGCDLESAELAGLLHDCARQYDHQETFKRCKKYGIPISESEGENLILLHAKLGAYLAEKEYHVTDPDILNAITYHTTGRPAMSLLEKIIYLADYIEPRRYKASNLGQARHLAFENLDAAMYLVLHDTLDYLKNKSNPIDPMTEEAYRYYKQLQEKGK